MWIHFGNTLYAPGLAMRSGPAGRQVDRVFHSDWLGSTRNLTAGTGKNITSGLRFDGYGKRSAAAGSDGAYPAEYQWAGAWGYQREAPGGPELGLDYLYQRYYEQGAGRFISRDPIRWLGGLNLYGYSDDDPVNAVDPLGLKSRSFWDWGIPLPAPVAEGSRFVLLAVDPTGIARSFELATRTELFTRRRVTITEDDMLDLAISMTVHEGGVPCPKRIGRSGKQPRLRQLLHDPKVSSADRGWIQQDLNQIARGKRRTIRVPPGNVLAHRRGSEAWKGNSYLSSDLQKIDLHKLQHSVEGYKR